MTKFTWHLAGDSTVAPAEPPRAGWGVFLGEFVDEPVRNTAVGGATTESFRSQGHWDRMVAAVRPGDRVVIQFGHNDQKHPELLAASGGYTERLDAFVREVRAAAATPVLCTSVERRFFDGDRVRPSHGPYPAAVRALGRARDVPVVELTVFTAWLYEHLGPLGSRQLFTEADNTHFHERGARAVAAYVARALRAIRGLDDAAEPMGRAAHMSGGAS
jgi:lysophospholipase L1-like esterase